MGNWQHTRGNVMTKKFVWLHISLEVTVDEGIDDDDNALMDVIHDELVEQGFIVDDMGISTVQEDK